MKKNNNTLITIILVIVVGGGAFFGGMKFQQSSQANSFNQFRQNQGQRLGVMGQGANIDRNSFRPVSGEIISSSDNSITVKLSDGSSKIVILSQKTVVNKTSEASKGDLKVGEKIAAFGQQNSDGSVTAQNIQLNPQTREIQVPADK